MAQPIEYLNLQTGKKIVLEGLSEELEKFYRQAVKKFMENVEWMRFEEFVFGARSPLHGRHQSHQALLRDPLYLALKDMWQQLGVQQGKMKRTIEGARYA